MEECMICFEETTDFIFFECQHKVCATCYPTIRILCPVCEHTFQSHSLVIETENVIVTQNENRLISQLYFCILFIISIIIIFMLYNGFSLV